jgi:membrane protein YdbS with pleckstrin-like domain
VLGGATATRLWRIIVATSTIILASAVACIASAVVAPLASTVVAALAFFVFIFTMTGCRKNRSWNWACDTKEQCSG